MENAVQLPLAAEDALQIPLAGSVAAAVLLASKSTAERRCAVCSDDALAVNFGVVTCESCKAFFRRNAPKEEQLKCLFSGQCFISIKTRHFCTACRLKKCLAVGMKKELILGEGELRRRRELTTQRRQARLVHQQQLRQQQQLLRAPEASGHESPGAELPSATAADWVESLGRRSCPEGSRASADEAAVDDSDAIDFMWQNLGSLATGWRLDAGTGAMAAAAASGPELAVAAADDGARQLQQQQQPEVEPCDRPQQPPPCGGPENWDRPQQGGEAAGAAPPTAEIVLASADAVRPEWEDVFDPGGTVEPTFGMGNFEPANTSSYTCQSSLARQSLSSADEATMAMLQQAFCTTIGMVTESEPGSNLVISDLESGINRTRVIVQRLIGFARCITEFTGLSMLVQMSLLKQAALPCITLCSAQLSDPSSSSSLSCGDGCIPVSVDVLGGLLSPSFSSEHRALVSSIKRLVPADAATRRCDLGVIVLLLVIVLLSPEYVLSAADCVQDVAAQLSDVQQHYIMLLSRYLQMRRSFAHAAVLLPALLNCITTCKQVALSTARVISCCDKTRIDPLLQEVYELDS